MLEQERTQVSSPDVGKDEGCVHVLVISIHVGNEACVRSEIASIASKESTRTDADVSRTASAVDRLEGLDLPAKGLGILCDR